MSSVWVPRLPPTLHVYMRVLTRALILHKDRHTCTIPNQVKLCKDKTQPPHICTRDTTSPWVGGWLEKGPLERTWRQNWGP